MVLSIPILIYIQLHGSFAAWVECLPMARETWVQYNIGSYQRL